MTWRCQIHDDIIRNRVTILLAETGRPDGMRVLTEDGGDVLVPPGLDLPSNAGIDLPGECLEALAGSLMKYLGNSLPSQGEVRVLREWLSKEGDRVDLLIGSRLGFDVQGGIANG